MRVRSSLQRPFYLLGCLSIGRKADFESANLGSSPSAPTNVLVMELADMSDSKPDALKSVRVRLSPETPILLVAKSKARLAVF